jgi:hypothetical protein
MIYRLFVFIKTLNILVNLTYLRRKEMPAMPSGVPPESPAEPRINKLILDDFEEYLKSGYDKENHYNRLLKGLAFTEKGKKRLRWFKKYKGFYILGVSDLTFQESESVVFITSADIIRAFCSDHVAKIEYAALINTVIYESMEESIKVYRQQDSGGGRLIICYGKAGPDASYRQIALNPLHIGSQLEELKCVSFRCEADEGITPLNKHFRILADRPYAAEVNGIAEPMEVVYRGRILISSPSGEGETGIPFAMPVRTEAYLSGGDSENGPLYTHILFKDKVFDEVIDHLKRFFIENSCLFGLFRIRLAKKDGEVKAVVHQADTDEPDKRIAFIAETVSHDFAVPLGLRLETEE